MLRKTLFIFLILSFLLVGCSKFDDENIDSNNYPPISPYGVENLEEIELYFPNKNMTKIEKETRVVKATKTGLYSVIIEELIKGTENPSMTNIIPEKTRLLSIEVVNRVAYVSFSNELINNNYTEAEEAFVIYSIVNTLTVRDEIDKVQILIEGQIKDVLNKRYTISYPKEHSLIIVNHDYQSPILVIIKYYEFLISNDYEGIINLYSSDKRDLQGGLFAPYYEQLQGDMYDYQINSYIITGYDNRINVTINSTIHYNNEKAKDNQTHYFELIYERGRYRFDNMGKEQRVHN